jgi:hypothetical protein
MITLFMNASLNLILVTVADLKQFLKRISGDSETVGKNGFTEGQNLTYDSRRKPQGEAGLEGWSGSGPLLLIGCSTGASAASKPYLQPCA